LYVSSYYGNNVLRYDGTTGAFDTDFVTAGSGTLNGPSYLLFVPSAVPEPTTIILLVGGLALLGVVRRTIRN
jgi:hypothetical protein